MAWYRIVISSKLEPPMRGLRSFDIPFPEIKKLVHKEANRSLGKENVKEITFFKLPDDHPDVLAILAKGA
jgi:hypothetical protein